MTDSGEIRIRDAQRADLETLVEYNLAMARETEGRELTPAVLRRGVAKALASAARGRYFVAELEGRVAGCLMLTLEWSDWRDGWFWWIESVYVRPDCRGRGVYSALHEHVRAAARAEGDVVGLRLYVEKSNQSAQRTYQRQGMHETDYLLYEETF